MDEGASLDLLADIGGTNARFALGRPDGSLEAVRTFKCGDFPDLRSMLDAYLSAAPVRPDRGMIAVAATIGGDKVTMTNHDWSFSVDDLRKALGLDALDVVNDFAAVALSIPRLQGRDLTKIGGGEAHPRTPIAVLGPGTGLGVSILVPCGEGWTPLATEGGHVTLSACDDREAAVIALLRRRFGHASAERAVSGPGLLNLYEALSEIGGVKPRHATPEAVTREAAEDARSLSAEAREMFCVMLGTLASNLALTSGSRGGVYIAGGVVPALGDAFKNSGFRRRFEDKGRFSRYLAEIPTYVIAHPHPALVGLRAILGSAGD